MNSYEKKKRAAEYALNFIKDGMVVGLGSGSTVAIFIKLLGEMVRNEGLDIIGIPTSYDVEILAYSSGLKIASLNEYPFPDIAIDGADEVDPNKNLIKGGGGALTREKIVDYAAKKLIIIVDDSKLVNKLCSKNPIPLEVLPFSWKNIICRLKEIGGEAKLRFSKTGKVGPIITDNGNFIIDFQPTDILLKDLKQLDINLKMIPGIFETGIFYGEKIYKVVIG
ncbi:MAG TPA: ribose 5-phosphate isomerase A, partial [Thermoprotei archaeon]|nr:ribose 5-phosphate isomerase A [Thermoprotei archaeon]